MSGEDRGQDEPPLSPRQIAEEEMVEELMGMGMYEEGLSYDQMKDILRVINESKNMAAMETESRASQEMTEYSPEIVSSERVRDVNPQPEIQKVIQIPKPSFSYRQVVGRASLMTHDQRSSQDSVLPEDPVSSSSSSPKILDRPSLLNRRHPSFLDTDAIFDRLQEEKNLEEDQMNKSESPPTPGNSSQIVSDNSQHLQSLEIAAEVRTKRSQKAEMWRLNPFDVTVEENDIPLQQPHRPVSRERAPFSFCHHQRAFEMRDKVMIALGNHLEEVAENWRSKNRREDSEIHWGSPIKVGTANSSLDKKPLSENKSMPANCESHEGENRDRASKRKANFIIDQMIFENDEEREFEETKKSKKPRKLILTTIEKAATRQDKMFKNLQISPKPEKSFICDILDSDTECDNDNLSTLRIKLEQKKKEQSATVPTDAFTRRRIIPPNPARRQGRGRGGGRKREDCLRKNQAKPKSGLIQRKPQKSESEDDRESDTTEGSILDKSGGNKMSSNEIEEELEKEDLVENERKNVVIKPFPIRSLGGKRQWPQFARIKRIQKDVDEQEQLKDQISRQSYAAMLRDRKHREQRRHEEEKQEKKRTEAQEEEHFLQEPDEIQILHDSHQSGSATEDVQCPMCNELFSMKEVQHHAEHCVGPYDSHIEPTVRQPSPDRLVPVNRCKPMECQVCRKFSTTDGTVYEDHVHNCLKHKRDQLENPHSSAPASPVFFDVPTSPVRYFKPISEQVGSDINYETQFHHTKDNPRISRSKNRKR